MALTPAEQQRLDDYQTMMGKEAGNLALALDSLSDVMALLGLHKVYCRVEKGPHVGYNEAAYKATVEAVKQFLTARFKLANK